MATIFFKSTQHQHRFLTTIQQLGKVYAGKLDPEYAAALYILAADLSTWQKAHPYIDRGGIDIPTMLEDIDFSGGYVVLVKLAGNLFNGSTHLEPLDFLKLDGGNFQVALTALKLRRESYYLTSITAQEQDDLARADEIEMIPVELKGEEQWNI